MVDLKLVKKEARKSSKLYYYLLVLVVTVKFASVMPALAENGVSEVLFTLRIFGSNNKPRHYLPQHVWQDLGRLDSLGFHIFAFVESKV